MENLEQSIISLLPTILGLDKYPGFIEYQIILDSYIDRRSYVPSIPNVDISSPLEFYIIGNMEVISVIAFIDWGGVDPIELVYCDTGKYAVFHSYEPRPWKLGEKFISLADMYYNLDYSKYLFRS